MADPVEVQIERALYDRVRTLPLKLPAAWRNTPFPGHGQSKPSKWLRVQIDHNEPERRHIGSDGMHRFFGLMQITVQWPKGVGTNDPMQAACQIIEHFPCDLILRGETIAVRVTARPSTPGVMVETNGNAIVPVSIPYETYH